VTVGRLTQTFQRLSRRERVLVSVTAVAIVVGLTATLHFNLQGRIDELEANIAEEQDALRQIYTTGAAFSVARAKFESAREQATKNATLNITTSVAGLVEPMTFEAVDRNGPAGNKQLKEFIEFKGSTKDKPIGARKKKGAGKKESAAGYFQRDQELTSRKGSLSPRSMTSSKKSRRARTCFS
jgi:FlaG/FlaF family flagellin (archaellin)